MECSVGWSSLPSFSLGDLTVSATIEESCGAEEVKRMAAFGLLMGVTSALVGGQMLLSPDLPGIKLGLAGILLAGGIWCVRNSIHELRAIAKLQRWR